MKCRLELFTRDFALCGLVLLTVFACRTVQDNKQKMLTARFHRHLNLLRCFPCREPQPRTVNVQELVGDQLKTSETVQPHVTLLHRCDKGTGYCGKPEQECKVSKTNNVVLVFFVTDAVLRTPSVYKEFTVANHTECSCQSIGNTIK